MRGKEVQGLLQDLVGGITPAYAGKRCSARTPTFRTWDHPRVCGEKTEEQKERAEYLGSPPRMRGKVEGAIKGCLCDGITPAYAGKSRRE